MGSTKQDFRSYHLTSLSHLHLCTHLLIPISATIFGSSVVSSAAYIGYMSLIVVNWLKILKPHKLLNK
jgi:hypothetical protein